MKYWVINNFAEEALVRRASEEITPPDEGWMKYDDPRQKKFGAELTTRDWPAVKEMVGRLNSEEFCRGLSSKVGIPELVPDDSLRGAGIHWVPPGGFLKMHVDFNRLGSLRRRVNLIVFLTKDWRKEWGGELELWDETMSRPVVRIDPEFNKAVIFHTTETSWHGHPDPTRCPKDKARVTLALYYYTKDHNPEAAAHSTIFKMRPGEVW